MIETGRLFELEDRLGSGAYGKRPTALVRGEGVYVWDVTGRRYLDATSGQGVAALGHCHPAVLKAINEQARTLVSIHESFYNDRRAELLALLDSITPADLSHFFLCNSGAEAIEGALKVGEIADRAGAVSWRRSARFTGRTTGALSMTWTPKISQTFSRLAAAG